MTTRAPVVSMPDLPARQQHDRRAPVFLSLLPPGVDTQLRSLEHGRRPDGDPATALRMTVEAIWSIVEGAASERALEPLGGASALLRRRELVQRATCALSTLIRRGIAAGAFQPRCTSWAIYRLPFAIVAGACAPWVLGLAAVPSLRASTAAEAALEVLRPRRHRSEVSR